MPRTVGIDLGASFSLISFVDKAAGQAKCIPGPYGETLCPSIIGLQADGSISVGAPAGRRSFSEPEGSIHSLKHLMGRGVDHVPDALKRALHIDSESREVLRVRLGECLLTPPEISAFILRELSVWAEVFLGGRGRVKIVAVADCG